MNFNSVTPMLWTEDLQASVDFYTKVLGFTCGEYNESWQWASLRKDETEIMLAKPNQHTIYEKIGFSGSFYFNVTNIEELWNALKDSVEIVYPLETFDWGMNEFAIKDNNGYILQFGENTSHE